MTSVAGLLRCSVVALAVGVGMTQPSRAQSGPETAPPLARTDSFQFVEITPLVEAPALKLQRIDGKMVDFHSLRGKVVLLSFWATWCPPCRRELPMLERLQQFLGDRDVKVVAVSVDRDGKPAVAGFLDRIGVKRLRPFLDPEGRVGARSPEEGVSPFVLYGLPITYVIDRQGRAAGYITGEVDWMSQEGLALLQRYADGQ